MIPATDGTWRALLDADAKPALVASIAVAIALGIFLVVRRATGALVEPLSPLPLTTAAILVLAWSMTVRLLLRDSIGLKWATTLAVALFAIACSFPAHRAVDWLIWLPVFLAYAAAPELLTRKACAPETRSISKAAPHESTVLQNLSRSRTTSGEEIIEGTVLAEFAPDERTIALHIAFCPPFERLPHVEAEVLDDTEANVKVAQVLHNGTRLEIRRTAPHNTPLAISIALFATDILER
jgi:hypothetical protein